MTMMMMMMILAQPSTDWMNEVLYQELALACEIGIALTVAGGIVYLAIRLRSARRMSRKPDSEVR